MSSELVRYDAMCEGRYWEPNHPVTKHRYRRASPHRFRKWRFWLRRKQIAAEDDRDALHRVREALGVTATKAEEQL